MMTHQPKPGDTVTVTTVQQEKFTGILLESPQLEKERDLVILKLPSGYNTGIKRANIKDMVLVSSAFSAKETAATTTASESAASKSRQKEPAKTQSTAALPRISILHTGGTIASKVDYKTGGVIARFTPEEILGLFPELSSIAKIDSRLIGNMFSEDIRFAHYNIMANEIQKEIAQGADGIIITHGTDTLHYTSAALSFMLENLPIPVILVGAQRSSDRGSSDAGVNLLSAAYFIAHTDFAGVAICMHENLSDTSCLILPGLKARKMHTSRRDAFRPVNASAWARVRFEEQTVQTVSMLSSDYPKKPKQPQKAKVVVRSINEQLKIGVLKAHPNLFAEEISRYADFNGLVIEGTGLGHLSVTHLDDHTKENARIFKELAALAKKIPVVMAPQTIYGRIHMDVYATARAIQESGVVGHLSDMTPETTFIKLAWLLSNYPSKEVRKLMTKDLKGEISERTAEGTFLA